MNAVTELNNGLILNIITVGDIIIAVLLFMIMVLLFAVVANTGVVAKKAQTGNRGQADDRQ